MTQMVRRLAEVERRVAKLEQFKMVVLRKAHVEAQEGPLEVDPLLGLLEYED